MKDKNTINLHSQESLLGEIRALHNLYSALAAVDGATLQTCFDLMQSIKSKAEAQLELVKSIQVEEPDDLRESCEVLRDTLQYLWTEMLALENHGHMAKPERVKQLLSQAFEMLNIIDPASEDEDEEP